MPAPQDIMNDGPGLRQRARETKAVQNTVAPEITKAPPATPPQNVDKIHPTAKFGSKKGEARLPVDQWMKPLTSYEDGVASVPETGPAILHKGEKVTPAKENPMKDLFSMVPGKGSEKHKKEIKHIVTSKTHDGKYLHKHVHHHPSHEDETHVSNDLAALKDHMAAHTDGAGGDPDAAQMTASPSPMPAPGGAAGAPPAAVAPPSAGAPPAPGM